MIINNIYKILKNYNPNLFNKVDQLMKILSMELII